MSDISTQVCRADHQAAHQGPHSYVLGIEPGQFDVTRLVEESVNSLPWSQIAHLAMREKVQEAIRAIDFKPLIDEAVSRFVSETLEKLDISGTNVKDYIRELARNSKRIDR